MRRGLLVPLGLAVGCFSPSGSDPVETGTGTAGTGGSTTATTGMTSSMPSTAPADSSTSQTDSSSSGSTGTPAGCGDGVVDAGEFCFTDDGFARTPLPGPVGALSHLHLLDLDGDDELDATYLDAGNDRVGVQSGLGDGMFSGNATASPFPGGFGPTTGIAIDLFTADNDVDVVFVTGQPVVRIGVLAGAGDGSFSGSSGIALTEGATGVVAGDLDDDNDADAIISTDAQTLVVYINSGVSLVSGDLVSFAGPVTALALADINQNGTLDGVWTRSDNEFVRGVLGMGDGTLGAPLSFLPSGSDADPPVEIALGLIDGDDVVDLVATQPSQGNVLVGFNDGNADFSGPTVIPTGMSPTDVGLADLDVDGALDIVAVDGPGAAVIVHFGDGLGAFERQQRLELPEATLVPIELVLADVNADTVIDVAVLANGDGQDLVIFLSNP